MVRSDKPDRPARHQNLTAVSDGHQPGAPVERLAQVLPFDKRPPARVEAHSHGHPSEHLGPGCLSQALLGGDRCRQGAYLTTCTVVRRAMNNHPRIEMCG
jgi:hypothetical protein